MNPVVAAEGVTFRIGAKTLVDSVSLALKPGEMAVVIGPNGAGKSTLARLVAGELKPSAGAVTYDGRVAQRWPAWRLACKRSMLPQKSSLSFPFTAADVVRIGAETVGRRLNAREQDARVLDALARADVVHLAARDYQTLSGGEQQRVQFARVLCQIDVGRSVEERQLLILDEPTASLDIKHQLIILDEAAALARGGCAILAVLHDVQSRGCVCRHGAGHEGCPRRRGRRAGRGVDRGVAHIGLRSAHGAARSARPIGPLLCPARRHVLWRPARLLGAGQQLVGVTGEAIGHEAEPFLDGEIAKPQAFREDAMRREIVAGAAA